MTPEELTEACWHCRREWNKASSVLKRVLDFKTHMSSFTRLWIYLQYNPLYAREARKKQGMLFGLDRDPVDFGAAPPVPSTGDIQAADPVAATRPGPFPAS